MPPDHVDRKLAELVDHQNALADLASKLADAMAGKDVDVGSPDAAATVARRKKSATFTSPLVVIDPAAALEQPSLVSALTEPMQAPPATQARETAAADAPQTIQEEIDVVSVVSNASHSTVLTQRSAPRTPPGGTTRKLGDT